MIPPPLIINTGYPDWNSYIEAVYQAFKEDFIDSWPTLQGTRVGIKKHPRIEDKEATFWHCITDSYGFSKREEDRYCDPSRCERIKWPRAMIENTHCANVKMWKNRRKNDERICLCYGNWEYLVVLAVRQGYLILWTAYEIRYAHTKQKLEREYNDYHTP